MRFWVGVPFTDPIALKPRLEPSPRGADLVKRRAADEAVFFASISKRRRCVGDYVNGSFGAES